MQMIYASAFGDHFRLANLKKTDTKIFIADKQTKVVTVFSPIEPPGGKAVVWGGCIRNDTEMAVSQPKIVRFPFCTKGFEEKIVLYHLRI